MDWFSGGRSLRSNDPIQKELQLQFIHLDPPYFYDCKDGEWEALSPDARQKFQISGRNYRWISNNEAAKAFLAFEGKPVQAKSSPRMIWDLGPQGLYNIIFSENRSAEELLLPHALYEEFVSEIERTIM